MRYTARIFSLSVFIIAFVAAWPALAMDEFGARFGDSAPSALTDMDEASGAGLQHIAPAAGDEALSVPTTTDAAAMIDPSVTVPNDAKPWVPADRPQLAEVFGPFRSETAPAQ